jgi:hypothetical protein
VNQECVASKTEPARLAEQHQSEPLDVNHQRKFPQVGSCVTPGASRESRVRMRIQNEGVSRGQDAQPIRLVCGPSHSHVGASQRGGLERSAWSNRRASLRPVPVNRTDLAFPRGSEMNPLSCSRFIASQRGPSRPGRRREAQGTTEAKRLGRFCRCPLSLLSGSRRSSAAARCDRDAGSRSAAAACYPAR